MDKKEGGFRMEDICILMADHVTAVGKTTTVS